MWYDNHTLKAEVSDIGSRLSDDQLEKVHTFLEKVRSLLATNDYTIKQNEKNIAFDRDFPIKDSQKKEILQSLTVEDCIAVDVNNNLRYEKSEIYKFLKNVDIFVYGELENLDLYIKMYIKEYSFFDKVIVISFHKEGVF